MFIFLTFYPFPIARPLSPSPSPLSHPLSPLYSTLSPLSLSYPLSPPSILSSLLSLDTIPLSPPYIPSSLPSLYPTLYPSLYPRPSSPSSPLLLSLNPYHAHVMFEGLLGSVRVSKAGRAELAVSDVCPATSGRSVRKSAAVRMAPHVPTLRETIPVSVPSISPAVTARGRHSVSGLTLTSSVRVTPAHVARMSVECGGRLNGESGSYQFPSPELDRYPHNVSCAWRITTSLNKVWGGTVLLASPSHRPLHRSLHRPCHHS